MNPNNKQSVSNNTSGNTTQVPKAYPKVSLKFVVGFVLFLILLIFITGSRFDRIYPIQKSLGLGSKGIFTSDLRGCKYQEQEGGGQYTNGRTGFTCEGTFTKSDGSTQKVKMMDNQVSFGGSNSLSTQEAESKNSNRAAFKPIWYKNEVVPDNDYETNSELGILGIGATLVVVGVIVATIYYRVRK